MAYITSSGEIRESKPLVPWLLDLLLAVYEFLFLFVTNLFRLLPGRGQDVVAATAVVLAAEMALSGLTTGLQGVLWAVCINFEAQHRRVLLPVEAAEVKDRQEPIS
ncbi:hypothetical protein TTRE_0000410501 [Trichuris trichiura]|uniref:Uncharacterized protein n=1 Tax=Trichuris trichiura TaxID=36087 RepID=A0A077Z5T4_TRITR|nr:hypothetical protein TTRE_0000410501 [Trichuris trichiura]